MVRGLFTGSHKYNQVWFKKIRSPIHRSSSLTCPMSEQSFAHCKNLTTGSSRSSSWWLFNNVYKRLTHWLRSMFNVQRSTLEKFWLLWYNYRLYLLGLSFPHLYQVRSCSPRCVAATPRQSKSRSTNSLRSNLHSAAPRTFSLMLPRFQQLYLNESTSSLPYGRNPSIDQDLQKDQISGLSNDWQRVAISMAVRIFSSRRAVELVKPGARGNGLWSVWRVYGEKV